MEQAVLSQAMRICYLAIQATDEVRGPSYEVRARASDKIR